MELTLDFSSDNVSGVDNFPTDDRCKFDPPLSLQLEQRIARDFTPRWHEQWGGKFVLHGATPPGPDAVRLDGNDYLGLTGHPEIIAAQIASLPRNESFVIQSGAFVAKTNPIYALETGLANWLGKEDVLICQSGYAANIGLLQTIADAQTPVYVDTLAHASLWEGVHAARATPRAFRHNDAVHLDRVMTANGPGLVLVDSIYSTTGAVCPLERIIEVAEKHGSMILVDESHSIGTHGPEGAGVCAALGLTSRVHFITASLAKAFAGRAGFFTLPKSLRYYMLCTSFPNVFSSCLLPHEVAGLAATFEVIKRSEDGRERLRKLTRRLRGSLMEMGYPIGHGTEQIISLEAGPEVDTLAMRDHFEKRGVFGAVFCAPATARNRSMLRWTLCAAMTDAEVDHIETVAKEVAALVRPWTWPIARRMKTWAGASSQS